MAAVPRCDYNKIIDVTTFTIVTLSGCAEKSALTDYENGIFGNITEHRLVNLYEKLILVESLSKLISTYLSYNSISREKYNLELLMWENMYEVLDSKFIVYLIYTSDQITVKYELTFKKFKELINILKKI